MAETQEKSSTNVPWVPLLAVLAAVAGLTTALLPSRSARPPAPIDSAAAGQGKVSARLWQDPMSVAREAAVAAIAKADAGRLPIGLDPLADEYDALADVPAKARPIVLVACEPGSPYAEDVERRVRDRAGVLQALAAEDYLPEESTTLRYTVVNREKLDVLPYESFHSFDRSKKPAVLVVWLADGVLDDSKGGLLHQLAAISQGLIKGSTALQERGPEERDPLPTLRVLGPSSSPQYRLMLEGVTNDEDIASLSSLASTRVYSCKASAPEAVLASGVSWVGNDKEAAKQPERQTAVALTRRAGLMKTGFRLTRTICPDDQIMAALWEELKARRVPHDANVAVVAELDSIYGRSATWAFLNESLLASDKATEFNLEALRGKRELQHIHTFTYMAGLDGALPKNALGAEEAKSKDDGSTSKKVDPTDDPTEGLSQVDYLRRLADQLALQNEDAMDDKKFRAVAVLGSDIYDKLQILRTLRPKLPDALFLTNNLDARFGHPDEWDETRNLLVASNYPLVPAEQWWSETPPFRDSLQAAMYAATRMAVGEEGGKSQWRGRPLMFQIGRHGAVQLADKPSQPDLVRFIEEAKRWANIAGCVACLGVMALLLWPSFGPQESLDPAAPGANFRRRVQLFLSPTEEWDPTSCGQGAETHAGSAPLRRRWTRSGTILPLLIILAAVLTACRYYWRHGKEPFAVLEGISIWPGDFLRTCVFLLAFYLVYKTLRDLRKNGDELERKFCMLQRPDRRAFERRRLARNLDPAPADPEEELPPRESRMQLWRRWWHDFWPQTDDYADDGRHVDVGHLWLQYKKWMHSGARLGRACTLLLFYFGALLCLRHALHEPAPDLPIRGSNTFSIVLLYLSGLSYLFVTFLVVDATELNWRSIRDLNRHRSDWHSPKVTHRTAHCCFAEHRACLEAEDCADYFDIEFIARRSEVVNRLVYYPFILLSLMLAARLGITDHYSWSPFLLIGYGANAAWAVYCAIRLPLEANTARQKSLKRLRRKLFARRVEEVVEKKKKGEDRDAQFAKLTVTSPEGQTTAPATDKSPSPVKSSVTALEQVIAQIETMNRGAFVGVWEQPVLRAVLLPSGSAGLWTLLQLLQN